MLQNYLSLSLSHDPREARVLSSFLYISTILSTCTHYYYSLELEKYVEFSLTNHRMLTLDRAEVSEFIWQLSQWLIEHEQEHE